MLAKLCLLYYSRGSETGILDSEDLRTGLFQALEKLGSKKKILAIPPDITRFHSRAGELTQYVWDYYGERLSDILPALGTHTEMTKDEIRNMYGNIPLDLFRVHRWKSELITLGVVPESYVEEVSEGKVRYNWPAQVNQLLVKGGHDLILSVGQVVPHEVVGMANFNKNIYIGLYIDLGSQCVYIKCCSIYIIPMTRISGI